MPILSTAIKTVLRIRPPRMGAEMKVSENSVVIEKSAQEELSFSFDVCFEEGTSQKEIYREVEPYLDNIAQGINTTVLAYGATGSGKTYTMCGTKEAPGIIWQMAESLFGKCAEILGALFSIEMSVAYMEIYNEKVYDLLSPEMRPLPVRDDSDGKVVVQGLTEKKVENIEEFRDAFAQGAKKRKSAKTLLNAESSRSHAVLSIFVSLSTESSVVRTKINLVDLAGSECNKRTGNEGERMIESANINRSLFVLNKVITSLGREGSRVPFRDSKLTRILQDSLGGMSDCLLVINVRGDASSDTLSTLSFASKTRKIRLKPAEEKARNAWRPRQAPKEPLSRSGVLPRNIPKGNSGRKAWKRTDGSVPRAGANANVAARKEKACWRPREKEARTEPAVRLAIQEKELLAILNSGDFLLVKSLPLIGDKRAQKILRLSKEREIFRLNELLDLGIPKKVVQGIEGNIIK